EPDGRRGRRGRAGRPVRRPRGRRSVRRGRGVAPAAGRSPGARCTSRAGAAHPRAPLRLRGRALDARGDRPRARSDARARPPARGPGAGAAVRAPRPDLARRVGACSRRVGALVAGRLRCALTGPPGPSPPPVLTSLLRRRGGYSIVISRRHGSLSKGGDVAGRALKVVIPVALLAVAAAIVAMTASASGKTKNVLVFGTSADPVALDGALISDGEFGRGVSQIYEGL